MWMRILGFNNYEREGYNRDIYKDDENIKKKRENNVKT